MSLAHVASGSQLASPDVALKRGVTCPRGVRETGDVASKRGVTCPRGVREPGDVARCGVKTWRHLPTWRRCSRTSVHGSGFMWCCQMWRQNVASLAHVASGSHVASPDVASECGVRTWRQAPWTCVASQDVASIRGVRSPGLPARVFRMCLQSSGDMCTPTGDPPAYYHYYCFYYHYEYYCYCQYYCYCSC